MPAIECDVLVVGSGASAVHAAWPLAEAGLSVAMVDPGNHDTHYAPLIPATDFLSLRRGDDDQHRYFLGDDFEGIPFGPVRVGAQLTPPRQFLTRHADQLAPVAAEHFAAMQSLALGGLGAGWGASTMAYIDEDLEGWPIGRTELQPHYDAVARRIGICGTNRDDLAAYTGEIAGMMPPARPDSNARSIFARYRRHRAALRREGLAVGVPRLAMLTRQLGGRGPLRYSDMEFWCDHERAVYRPRYTVEELRRFPNFAYHDGSMVESFAERDSGVDVTVRDLRSNERTVCRARRLVLAAGTLGTARIVLRSLGRYDEPLPLVSNPYTYYPCLNLPRLGERTANRRHSLTQVAMIFDPDGTRRHLVQPQVYSYRSLLLFKLLKESPLAHRESREILRLLQEYFVIMGVFHEDRPAPSKRVVLRRGDAPERDCLEIGYEPTRADEQARTENENRLLRLVRRLGIWKLRRIDPGHGSSIHYGGTLPMGAGGAFPLGTAADGTLRAARRVVVSDGSAFPHLPAKGLTFTLMANANRVGTLLAREMRRGAVDE